MNEDPTYWLAFYADRSGFAVFPSEIQALRHAVANGMEVKPVKVGEVF